MHIVDYVLGKEHAPHWTVTLVLLAVLAVLWVHTDETRAKINGDDRGGVLEPSYWDEVRSATMYCDGVRSTTDLRRPEPSLVICDGWRGLRASAAPASPSTGQVWYDRSANRLRMFDGSCWAAVNMSERGRFLER